MAESPKIHQTSKEILTVDDVFSNTRLLENSLTTTPSAVGVHGVHLLNAVTQEKSQPVTLLPEKSILLVGGSFSNIVELITVCTSHFGNHHLDQVLRWKKPTKSEWTSTLIVIDFSGWVTQLYKTHHFNQLVGCEIYGSFRTSRFCMLSGAKTLSKRGERRSRTFASASPKELGSIIFTHRESWSFASPLATTNASRI